MSGLLLGAARPASATTLNFDSIATPNCGTLPQDLIPGSYGGFTWDANLAVECDADYTGADYANSYGAPSAANVIYNQAGTGAITITRGADFEFDGATFSGWTIGDFVDLVDQITAQSVTVTGYLGGTGGTLVGTESLTLAGADGTAALQDPIAWCHPGRHRHAGDLDAVDQPNVWELLADGRLPIPRRRQPSSPTSPRTDDAGPARFWRRGPAGAAPPDCRVRRFHAVRRVLD